MADLWQLLVAAVLVVCWNICMIGMRFVPSLLRLSFLSFLAISFDRTTEGGT